MTAGTYAQTPQSSVASQGSIELLHADSLVGTTNTKTGLVRHYNGNVSFRHNDASVTCRNAFHNISEDLIDLSGHVTILQRGVLLSSEKMNYNGRTKIAASTVPITIKDGSQLLKAKRGTYSTQTHIANFAGDVFISDGKIVLTSDSAEQNRRTNYSHAFGNVFVKNGDTNSLFADDIEYFAASSIIRASGSVLATDITKAALIVADTIEDFKDRHYINARGNSVLFKIDTLKQDSIICRTSDFSVDTLTPAVYDTFSIKSRTMELITLNDSTSYIFHGKAEIDHSSFDAIADSVSYLQERELIFLNGNPVIWSDSLQLSADTINIVLDSNKVKQIIAAGNAFMLIKNDTLSPERRNQLFGNNMVIDFVNGKINLVTASGNAQSLIFIDTEKGNDGATTSSADTIQITFSGSDPENFIATGGIIGEVIPEKDISDNCKQYYLPSYIERTDKPTNQKPKLKEISARQNLAESN